MQIGEQAYDDRLDALLDGPEALTTRLLDAAACGDLASVKARSRG